MRWLIHGNLTPAVRQALERHGHSAVVAEEIELPADASPFDVLEAARIKQVDVLTNDPKLASAPYEQQTRFNRVMVFLQLEGSDVEQDDAIDRLFARYKRLTPGRLYSLTASRVKVRQLPQSF